MASHATVGLFMLLAGCGYSSRVVAPHGGDLELFVAPVISPGLDVDAAGLVDAELRREVARGRGLSLSAQASAGAELHAELIDVRTQLAPFADPSLRAAQYEVQVSLRARLVRRDGGAPWRSSAVLGRASFLSTGGRLEALDGAGRRALRQAVQQASEQLVAAMSLALR